MGSMTDSLLWVMQDIYHQPQVFDPWLGLASMACVLYSGHRCRTVVYFSCCLYNSINCSWVQSSIPSIFGESGLRIMVGQSLLSRLRAGFSS